jgi:DNA polymerase beta
MVLKQVIIDEFKTLINKLKSDISIMESKLKSEENQKSDSNSISKKDISAVNFKIRNYHKVIKSLEDFSETEISNSSILKDLPGIGKGTLTRIDEIINNGKLEEGHKEISEEDQKLAKNIESLMTITGIGPAKAVELNKTGVTLEQLLNEYEQHKDDITKSQLLGSLSLTHHQIIGLKYYHQFTKRIPRGTITKIDKKLQKSIKSYLKSLQQKIEVSAVICGSYRRGCKNSGDIDLLISGDAAFDLIDFVKFLTTEGLVIDHLTEKGTTKFMGVCEGGYRLDIRFIPEESFGAALMYFTGSKVFNTLVRTEALKLGYTLEEYGIYPLLSFDQTDTNTNINTNIKKVSHSHQHLKGEKIACPTEEVIFDILKIDKKYLDPVNRNLEENVTSIKA